MKLFNDDTLSITDVHVLLLKPRDLTKDEYLRLMVFIKGLKMSRLLDCANITSACIQSGSDESNGDVRRMLKDNALSIGKRKITDFNDVLAEDDFFETGFEDVKWTTVRHGKKKAEFIWIMKDEVWFDLDYETWKNEREKKD